MKECLIEKLAFTQLSESSFEATELEYEIEIYLEGYDIEQIRSMSTGAEAQAQWGIYVPKSEKNATSGSIRVRKTENLATEDVKYIRTTKTNKKDKGNLENERETDQTEFEQFEQMSEEGLIKTRYFVPIRLEDQGIEVTLEVDAFTNKAGVFVPWVKIDAEVEQGVEIRPEHIPFTYKKMHIVTPERKQTDKALVEEIGKLYEEYFRSKNIHI